MKDMDMEHLKQKIGDRNLRKWLLVSSLILILITAGLYLLLSLLIISHFTIPIYRFMRVLVPLLALILLSWIMDTRIEFHVSRLTQGMQTVAEGDYTVRVTPHRNCPIQPAYDAFNKMAAELDSVETLRESFVNDFSHEFKTPISAIQGFAELLQSPETTEEERAEYLNIIVEESTRLSQLTDSTLLLSRLDAQAILPNRQEYALDEQIKRCAILLTSSWESKNISFSADLDPVRYAGDADLMRHVWINLMNNAIKYTPAGGEIEISLREADGQVVFSITDTGIGMTSEVQAHIFDRYYQGDASHSESGLGLGLSIVRQIVKLHGGEISVRSQPDQGSEFTVRLPKAG